MKKILFLLSAALMFSCSSDKENEYPKVTAEYEKTVTIASEMLYKFQHDPCLGGKFIVKTYAYRYGADDEWKSFDGFIDGFKYERGNEYTVKYKSKAFYDPRMSVAEWVEQTLVEEISSEEKVSEGLPKTFLPSSVSNEEDDFLCVEPVKVTFTTDPKNNIIDGDRYIIKIPFSIYIKPGTSNDVKDYWPLSAKIITEQGLERDIVFSQLNEIDMAEIFTADDRNRLIAQGDGAIFNFKLAFYDKSQKMVQETTLTFDYVAD